MDEDLAIIASNTRKEQIKTFFIKHKKKIYLSFFFILIAIFSFFFYLDVIKKDNIKTSNKFINLTLNYNENQKDFFIKEIKEIIKTNDTTYAPLALFFLVDNKIINKSEEINDLFNVVLNNTKADKEIKNLMLYKKALINVDEKSENEVLNILKPVINSESFWKPHALLLIGDYFLSRNENEKAKDFYSQILNLKKNNKFIFNQAQLRLNKNYD